MNRLPPEAGWLARTDLDLSDGVPSTTGCAFAEPPAYAAGDLARITDADGTGRRIAHWNHAIAKVATQHCPFSTRSTWRTIPARSMSYRPIARASAARG